MSWFQSAIAAVVLVMMPALSLAKDDEVTMEIIESLDDLNTHNRIKLPERTVVQDTLDMAVEKMVVQQKGLDNRSKHYRKQREQLQKLMADNDDGARQSTATHSNANNADPSAGQVVNNRQFQPGVADHRNEMVERRQEIAGDVKGDMSTVGLKEQMGTGAPELVSPQRLVEPVRPVKPVIPETVAGPVRPLKPVTPEAIAGPVRPLKPAIPEGMAGPMLPKEQAKPVVVEKPALVQQLEKPLPLEPPETRLVPDNLVETTLPETLPDIAPAAPPLKQDNPIVVVPERERPIQPTGLAGPVAIPKIPEKKLAAPAAPAGPAGPRAGLR